MGFRYSIDAAPLPSLRRRADILFRRERVAVFVDGCFWHGCPRHKTLPKTNADWWRAKLSANIRRDRDTDSRLRAASWLVVRVWAHEAPDRAAHRVQRTLARRRASDARTAERGVR
jgi:DNA mismatch endonuclease (patch repair protein)